MSWLPLAKKLELGVRHKEGPSIWGQTLPTSSARSLRLKMRTKHIKDELGWVVLQIGPSRVRKEVTQLAETTHIV